LDHDRSASSLNLFVTGRPGVGKTTLILKVLERLGTDAGGFFTREIREGGRRLGFTIADLGGDTGVLAHVDQKSLYRVGKYGVNRRDLERVGVPAIERAVEGSSLVVMDEIGRMELCSPAFRSAVEKALDSPRTVFGTIQDRRNQFLDSVRARPDVTVLRVTVENRDALAGQLVERISASLAEREGRSSR